MRHGRCRAARGRADDQPAIGDAPRAQSASRPRRAASTSSAPAASAVASAAGKPSGAHEPQCVEPHGLHRTGRRADVAGMCGCRRGRCGSTCSGILPALCAGACPPLFTKPPVSEVRRTPCSHCSTSPFVRRAAPGTSSSATSTGCHRSTCAPRAATTSSSEVDQLAERDIIETVRRVHPDHGFLGEESWVAAAATSSCGSSIRSTARPTSCTGFRCSPSRSPSSIAAGSSTRVVYDPMRQELFTASRGDGAQLDGTSHPREQAGDARWRAGRHGLSVSRERTLDRRVHGHAQGRHARRRPASVVRAPRRSTSPTSRPAASTRIWEIGLSPWDTAAGTLLITEAGGRVGTLTGEPYAQGGHIVAGTPKVYDALLACIGPHVPASLRDV